MHTWAYHGQTTENQRQRENLEIRLGFGGGGGNTLPIEQIKVRITSDV